jgi:HEAT repeat protein
MVEELLGEKKALDLGEEMPLIEGVEADEELLLARDLIASLIKAIKAVRFYPPDNPIVKGFRDQLVKKFQVFLNKYPFFIFQVGEYELSFKGKVMYENRDINNSLAFLFYKDGIRKIRFANGLEEWEIQKFLDVIKQGENINELEDDLVTLLWEMDFNHISYVATDAFLEDKPILIPEDVKQFRSNLVFEAPGHQVEVGIGDGTEEVFKWEEGDYTPSFLDRTVYLLTNKEVEGLRNEVESEIAPAFAFNVIDILFEILALEKIREPYQDTVNIILKVLDSLLPLGDFQRASDLLKRAYIFLKTNELKDWQKEIIQKLIQDAGEEQRIDMIGKFLEKEEVVSLEDLSSYLVLLQQNSIKPMIKLLAELKNLKTRRVVLDALSKIGKDAIELFTPFLDDPRWYLVRNITYIIGRIGKEQSIPYIQKAFNHQDARVRREAVQALGLIGGTKAISLLVRALTDGDVRIRAVAAINLGKVGKTAGLAVLLGAVQSKDFKKRDRAEIKAFFDAIGMVGSNEAIPALQQLLERKGWFSRGSTDEIRMGAANALAMIGTSEAKVILEKGKFSKEESIRNACLQALKGKVSKESLD